MQKILPLEELVRKIASHRLHGKKIIFVHGIFDLLHRGHVTLLAEAKKLDGILVVGVEGDKNTQYLKGPDRPIHSQEARLFVLSYLTPVDYVFLIPDYENQDKMDEFYSNLYRQLQVDILVTCVNAGRYGPLKKSHAHDAGIQFVDIPERYERNTTRVIELLKGKQEGFDYFDHKADMGIVGRGKTIEAAFVQAALAVFTNMADLEQIKPKKTLSFEFIEQDNELALVEWLNLLIGNARAEGLVFSHFTLKREGDRWQGSASGDYWNEKVERGTEVKGATLTLLSVKKTQDLWEVRCVVDV